MPELTLARLKELLHYDPETGIFTNRITRGPRAVKGTVAGSINSDGYCQIKIDRKIHLAHRLAVFYMTGEWPPAGIDHINGVNDDNRISKLRPATQAINLKNQKLPKNTTTGVCGVSFNKQHKKYQAHICVNGKNKLLGYYDTLEEATKARKAAEEKYGYHENHGLSQKERAKK